jgi:hypothetical protein
MITDNNIQLTEREVRFVEFFRANLDQLTKPEASFMHFLRANIDRAHLSRHPRAPQPLSILIEANQGKCKVTFKDEFTDVSGTGNTFSEAWDDMMNHMFDLRGSDTQEEEVQP